MGPDIGGMFLSLTEIRGHDGGVRRGTNSVDDELNQRCQEDGQVEFSQNQQLGEIPEAEADGEIVPQNQAEHSENIKRYQTSGLDRQC